MAANTVVAAPCRTSFCCSGGVARRPPTCRCGTHASLVRRARRELVRPEDVGLPSGSRRRVPGLPREEVALLAGISRDYYLRLEQGRDRQLSLHREKFAAQGADGLRLVVYHAEPGSVSEQRLVKLAES